MEEGSGVSTRQTKHSFFVQLQRKWVALFEANFCSIKSGIGIISLTLGVDSLANSCAHRVLAGS